MLYNCRFAPSAESRTMLTYRPDSAAAAKKHPRFPWPALLLVLLWLWPGVFSHDLWKPEAPVYAAVAETAAAGGGLVPVLFGAPFLDMPPVYMALAVLLHQLFSPWLMDAYASVRTASVLFAAVGLLGSGMAARRLTGSPDGRNAVLILIGSAGLLPVAHFMGGAVVWFAAAGLIWWGLAVSGRQVVFASALSGLGVFLLVQSAGLVFAAAAAAVLLLLSLHPLWRGIRHTAFVGGTLAVALPLSAVYPLALRLGAPDVYQLWLNRYLFGGFGGAVSFQAAFSLPYYLKNLFWFAFPAWPLAVWTATRTKLWRQRYGAAALVWLVLFGAVLAVLPERYQDYLVLLLPPLAILGAAHLDSLRRGATAFLNWFGMMAFGLAALLLWLVFVAANYGFPAKLAERAAYFSPFYTPGVDALPMLVALLFTPVWLYAVTRKRVRGQQAVTNWAAGMTLVWALLMTILLPWIDAAKSYRPVFERIEAELPAQMRADLDVNRECLYVAPHETELRVHLQEYTRLPYTATLADCRYHLIRAAPGTEFSPAMGRVIWHGARPRSKRERFYFLDRG